MLRVAYVQRCVIDRRQLAPPLLVRTRLRSARRCASIDGDHAAVVAVDGLHVRCGLIRVLPPKGG